MSPVWTPDSKRIVWTSTRAGGNPNLFWQPADGTGTPERLTDQSRATSFRRRSTPDGRTIALFGSGGNSTNAMDIFTVGLDEPERQAEAAVSAVGGTRLRIPRSRPTASGSPTTRTNRASSRSTCGRFRTWTTADGRSRPSGGTRAAWARNGRELFYLDKDGFLTSVPVLPPAGACVRRRTAVEDSQHQSTSRAHRFSVSTCAPTTFAAMVSAS